MRKIIAQRPYMHFKGKIYYVHHITIDVDTNNSMVSYQALYPPYDFYSRELKEFADKIDKNREDNCTNQTYRFELYE